MNEKFPEDLVKEMAELQADYMTDDGEDLYTRMRDNGAFDEFEQDHNLKPGDGPAIYEEACTQFDIRVRADITPRKR